MRTIGAKDKSLRKSRSDKGKQRKRYRGKIVVRRKPLKFNSRVGHKTHLKLWIWKREKMSKSGIKNWNPRIRGKIRKIIYKFGDRFDVPIEELANTECLEQFALDYIRVPGRYLIMGCSGSPKTKVKIKWVKLFAVSITETPEGIFSRITTNYRMWRYKWIWKQ